VGKEFRADMLYVGMPMETRYTEIIVMCRQNLIHREHALEACVSISGLNQVGVM